ncbi:HlyD family efflux transporter periplasmic adaptor subunit [Bosea sp. CS1GBMeth4]|uniref:HlyD family secretion protein n=1 Tax=Bosea sp. CS1GBMeth4 TaxID=1892849 RepID=UPI00164662EA|nr:HlyD family efflux transporter periplasmic adaptor subunit [Bosea sp. CS1GBMeth4]
MRISPILLALAAVAALGGYVFVTRQGSSDLPAGLAQANGRIEVERVDVATKLPGRIADILVREGDFVGKGAIIARMDVSDLLAQLAVARAGLRRAEEGVGKARADLGSREAELRLHEVELQRALDLGRHIMTQAEADKRLAQRDVAKALLVGARAGVADAEAARDAAQAQVHLVQVSIDDMTLSAPVAGRVEYRLAQPGEVIAAGGRVATMLDVSDVFMTIFLPTSEVGRVALGSDARIVLDAAPQYVVPASVSFVAGEAQFTPKYVETRNEREKLMYRVKLKIDPKLLDAYRDYVKAGLTGTATVKIAADAAFPDRLRPNLPLPPRTGDVR